MAHVDSPSKVGVFENTWKLLSFLKMGRVNMWYFALSILFSLLFSLSALYVFRLLFPLVRGLISGDFSYVQNLWGLSFFVRKLPNTFSTSSSLFVLLVVWIYAVTIAKNIFQYLASLSTQIQARIATVNVRQMLIEKCLGYGKKFYDQNTISYLQSVLAKSTNLIESQFGLFQALISQSLLVLVCVLVMVTISWKLTLVTAVAFPLISLLTRRIIQKIRNLSQEHDRVQKSLNEKIFNMLYCMPVIKGFSKERQEIANFSAVSEQEIGESFKVQRMMALARPVEDVGTMTGILCVAIGLAFFMRVEHVQNSSQMIVFLYLAMRVIPGISAFSNFKLKSASAAAALRDIEHVLQQDGSVVVPGGQEKFTGLTKGIEIKGLSFRYAANQPLVLDRVSFSIDKRSILAIVGPSGSGKSTLVNLLLRFYDCPQGSIFVDGQDIREYDVATLRKYMAFVSQEVLLFNDTVRNNILYGTSSEVSDEFFQEIGMRVHVHDFIDKMPNKYDTSVGERGSRLSGGERQRLSIARAIIKDPEILIMDEATSALDSSTEARINDFVLEVGREKTLIIIAHRISTIKKADKIIYLDKGKVVESGTLQELIDKKGAFYKQWEAQKL
ncbi:MAG: ABC transporter ATP-binding protein [Candidatus Omnitrophica bacterium]|nr:ABC transporter ATP-binding protein [Candidatus Omnitrophota bacterium]